VSRTDKTKPWRVRVMEHRPWANHDHSDGVCDLPEHYKDNQYAGGTHCRWSDWNLCYKGNCCYGCGCHLCTDQPGRKAKRRRERHQARALARIAVKGARHERG
jgi:hypothetical protein